MEVRDERELILEEKRGCRDGRRKMGRRGTEKELEKQHERSPGQSSQAV